MLIINVGTKQSITRNECQFPTPVCGSGFYTVMSIRVTIGITD